jgi:uncharacterized protein with HEPN domain
MTSPNGDQTRIVQSLRDVLAFAAELDTYVVSLGEQHFHDDRPTQLVAEALIHRIGEAVSRLPDEFVDAQPQIAWRQMRAMRNVVAHQYGFIDYAIVWRALTTALPADIAAIEAILDALR